jgi:hypothetical protein
MKIKKNTSKCRRYFVATLLGLFSGLMTPRPGRALASKIKIKKLLWNIESEILERSRPFRHPAYTWKCSGDKIFFYFKGKSKPRPLFTINPVGRTIWEGCNGKNTPNEIANLLHEHFLVSPHKAYIDCLSFLAVLKDKGLILL